MTENIEHTILEVSVSNYDLAKNVNDYIIEDIESNLHKLEAYNDTESFRRGVCGV